jgi:hypothetical protein
MDNRADSPLLFLNETELTASRVDSLLRLRTCFAKRNRPLSALIPNLRLLRKLSRKSFGTRLDNAGYRLSIQGWIIPRIACLAQNHCRTGNSF